MKDNQEENLENDKFIEEGESYAIVEQEEELLSFSIENLYSDEKEDKYRKPRSLRSSPPLLEVSSSNGDSVTFPLTKEFTKSLLRVVGDVNYAYLGMTKVKKRLNMGEKLSFPAKVNDVFEKTKLSIILLALGMLLGISIGKSFVLGIAGSIVLSGIAILVHYSKENNKEISNNKKIVKDTNEEEH